MTIPNKKKFVNPLPDPVDGSYDGSIELEAYSEGFNQAIDEYHKGIDEAPLYELVQRYCECKCRDCEGCRRFTDKIRALLK